MKSITYSAARENLAKTMTKVCEDHDGIIITRKRDQAVVMLSLEDYESLKETAYLLRSPVNARRLAEGIAELERGEGVMRDLADFQ
jgi:antitoxin YefM